MGSRAQVLAWASHTKPRLKSRALRLYFLCSMHTGQPISFFSMAVLDEGNRWEQSQAPSVPKLIHSSRDIPSLPH